MMGPDTEILDKLYLEWSQFTTARTQNELTMIAALKEIRGWREIGSADTVDERLRAIEQIADAAIASVRAEHD